MAKKLGALPSQVIRDMMNTGFVQGANHENVNPASLDLSMTGEVYRINGIFLPPPAMRVRDMLSSLGAIVHSLKSPLERDVSYLVKVSETLSLPDGVYGYCNPKSSTGRNDVLVRIVADGVSRFDAATPAGFKGEIWCVIIPKSFPIKIYEGMCLSQIRFFNQDTRHDELELQIEMARNPLVWNKDMSPISYSEVVIRDNDGSIILTIDLEGDEHGYVGWERQTTRNVLDLSQINHYAPSDFFRPLSMNGSYIALQQGGFYILRTKERVLTPPHLACEMAPMDVRSGEFRSHYAGYIDPGWGYGINGEGKGRPIVLEVRPFEDIVLGDYQPIGKVKFEKMTEIPDILYDQISTSHYTAETGLPRLSKHFAM